MHTFHFFPFPDYFKTSFYPVVVESFHGETWQTLHTTHYKKAYKDHEVQRLDSLCCLHYFYSHCSHQTQTFYKLLTDIYLYTHVYISADESKSIKEVNILQENLIFRHFGVLLGRA